MKFGLRVVGERHWLGIVSIGGHYYYRFLLHLLIYSFIYSFCSLYCDMSIVSSEARSSKIVIWCFLFELQVFFFSLKPSSSCLRLLPLLILPIQLSLNNVL